MKTGGNTETGNTEETVEETTRRGKEKVIEEGGGRDRDPKKEQLCKRKSEGQEPEERQVKPVRETGESRGSVQGVWMWMM